MPDLELTSPAFDDGEPIPEKHTADGEGSSPALRWDLVPEGTRTLALIVHDPDAPSGDFTHWLAWNIDPESGSLDEGVPAPGEGTHGFGGPGWTGPAPPEGHGPHRYFFELYALDTDWTWSTAQRANSSRRRSTATSSPRRSWWASMRGANAASAGGAVGGAHRRDY